jgi:uncharacterized protein YaaQ
MKLILAVVHRRDLRGLHDALVTEELRFTEIPSAGGLLGAGNVTLLMAVADEAVERVVNLVRANCPSREETVGLSSAGTRGYAETMADPMTVSVGGADVFVLNIERVEHV